MMPLEGCYSIKKVDRHHFFGRIKEVRAMNDFLMSWIGYEQNADVIEANTGWRPPICRDVTKIDHGDRLLMMRLKYRPEQRAKGFQVDAHDFEYFEAYYVEQTPVPSWHDLMGMDIHEPAGQAYLEAIYRLKGGDMVSLRAAHQLLENAEYPEAWTAAHDAYLYVLRLVLDFEGLKNATDI
jgi:hypothetical protein